VNDAYVILIRAFNEDPVRLDLPTAGIQAYTRSVERNPAFLFHEDLFYGYFGAVPLVEAPPLSTEPVTEATIHYSWWGLGGDPLEYNVRVSDADSAPRIEITMLRGPSAPESLPQAPTEQIQALPSQFTDLIPIAHVLQILRCTDNYSDWTVQFRFSDGSQLSAFTNGSNFIPSGGPWQVEISGQTYVQMSTRFAQAIFEFVTGLGLPLGQPAAMACFPVPVFTQVYGE
jgi:hypothetical protein